MKYDWILDILGDLKSFSSANGLHALAKELDEVQLLAVAEIASALAREEERGDARRQGRRLQ
ncbi:hypothetical protein NBRC116601_28630 [Cognatishimia sp. WU-CL00825]|uniref:hypothetical protein n=1 Tax=Cognatishimia sp. WU-CL00825 TaxID=3127658 RepID=UPI003107F0D1